MLCVKAITVRFHLSHPAEKQAWEKLNARRSERHQSFSQLVVEAVNAPCHRVQWAHSLSFTQRLQPLESNLFRQITDLSCCLGIDAHPLLPDHLLTEGSILQLPKCGGSIYGCICGNAHAMLFKIRPVFRFASGDWRDMYQRNADYSRFGRRQATWFGEHYIASTHVFSHLLCLPYKVCFFSILLLQTFKKWLVAAAYHDQLRCRQCSSSLVQLR